MKRIILAVLSLLFSILLPIAGGLTACAQTPPITVISDIFHREVNGKFTDDSLGEAISYFGDIYKKVSQAPKKSIWVIDPQLIEEIIDMSDGYTVLPKVPGAFSDSATNFLAFLRASIADNQVYALPYGSPDITVRSKVSDVELSQIQNISALRLARALDIPVSAGLPEGLPTSGRVVSVRAKNAFGTLHKTLNKIGTITSDPEVAEIALRSNALLNPNLSAKQAQYLAISLNGTVDRLEKKVKVLPGKYTLTSTNEKIPVTVVNEFAAPADVVLILHAENARIIIDTAEKITLAKNSRKQVLIDAKAVANGKVRVEARLETVKGARYGESNSLQFSISMIGPVITWVMVSAGILLLGASGIRISRRLRGRKSEGR
ncbi:MAG: hypothetical protein EBT44_02990 [Actinobacteria bacterium]|uniref:Uncharacterized protein n=1 Tax=Candidatus Fonsibacter lacus TaxID=2576439 RepID=A0A965GC82_9PROT|nr:hypothetical protein [Candidatus Fonsibacter lacus]